MAKADEVPKEITQGILGPFPKPGKPRGPPSNLRPIIRLTTLRKILAVCTLGRVVDKFKTRIPKTQAAYQEGRGTTEYVFICKVLAEKTRTSENYDIVILLLDMSKAFDTVRRNSPLQQLKQIIGKDEPNIIKILITDRILKVRIGRTIETEIKTNIGVLQGDSLSPILFILYLANALTPKPNEEHNHCKPSIPAEDIQPNHLKDHIYSIPTEQNPLIEQQYADDTVWIEVNGTHRVDKIEKEAPDKLKDNNLGLNTDKTEKHHMSRKSKDDRWKKSKYNWKSAKHRRRC